MNSHEYDDELENGPEAELVDGLRVAASPEVPVAATFDRALSRGFIEALRAEKEAETGGWWRDVLGDEKLVIAPRGGTLDVYWRGARLFHVSFANGALSVTTHEKYLLNPALEGQASLQGGNFDLTSLKQSGFTGAYMEGQTLKAMKTAAGVYTDVEKIGCHEIAVHNSSVIDCEIAFPRAVTPQGSPVPESAGRADLAALEAYGEDVHLVFWEAKRFKNPELRSAQGLPAVCGQIAKYRSFLADPGNQTQILASYRGVSENLVALREMGWRRELSRLVQDVVAKPGRLVMGAAPKVGLLVFGFDKAQKDDREWQRHLSVLRNQLGDPDSTGKILRAVGDAKTLKLLA